MPSCMFSFSHLFINQLFNKYLLRAYYRQHILLGTKTIVVNKFHSSRVYCHMIYSKIYVTVVNCTDNKTLIQMLHWASIITFPHFSSHFTQCLLLFLSFKFCHHLHTEFKFHFSLEAFLLTPLSYVYFSSS